MYKDSIASIYIYIYTHIFQFQVVLNHSTFVMTTINHATWHKCIFTIRVQRGSSFEEGCSLSCVHTLLLYFKHLVYNANNYLT